jgi:hypothetical protein
MKSEQEFQFICDEKMAQKIDRIIALNGGEILATKTTSDGTAITVRKLSTAEPSS